MSEKVEINDKEFENPARDVSPEEKRKIIHISILNAVVLVLAGMAIADGPVWFAIFMSIGVVTVVVAQYKERIAFGNWRYSAGKLSGVLESSQAFDIIVERAKSRTEDKFADKPAGTNLFVGNPDAKK